MRLMNDFSLLLLPYSYGSMEVHVSRCTFVEYHRYIIQTYWPQLGPNSEQDVPTEQGSGSRGPRSRSERATHAASKGLAARCRPLS